MTLNIIIRLIIATAVILVADQFGFWVWLVAHPFWNFKGALIGIAIGTGILLLTWLLFKTRPMGKAFVLGLPILAVLISAGITFYGKSGFAESFGEDRMSGILWYYGYLALTTSSFLALFVFSRIIFGQKCR